VKISVEKPKEKGQAGGPRLRQEDNIKIDFEENLCDL
jgi:hypothetical protein